MADRIAIMQDGVIKQVGTPIEIYENPEEEFIADFIGDSNCLVGEIKEARPPFATFVSKEGLRLEVVLRRMEEGASHHKIFVRPEKIALSLSPRDEPNCLQGLVKHITYMGAAIRYLIEVEGACDMRVDEQNRAQRSTLKKGESVFLSFSPENCICFCCSEKRTSESNPNGGQSDEGTSRIF